LETPGLVIPLLPKGEFQFDGKSLPYFRHRYNLAWINERALEIPGLEPRFRRGDGRESRLAALQFGRQLVPPHLRPVLRIFGRIRRLGLGRQRGDLLTQPPFFVAHPSVTHRLVFARMGFHLRPIHRHCPELDDACFAGDRHDLHEQRLERRQVLLPKLRDRSVGRKIARRQHAIGYIVFQLPRDPTRRKRPRGIGVQQHGHHHLRVERLIAPPIAVVGRIERLEIHRGHGIGDEERYVPFGEPVTR
jgi:hypothetical protein